MNGGDYNIPYAFLKKRGDNECYATSRTAFGVSKLKRRLSLEACLCQCMSKWHIVGNHMSRLICIVQIGFNPKNAESIALV